MKEMGFKSYRFSISWSRVFPDGVGEVNEKGIQFYRDLIDELLKNGIEPIVTLYHYDLPWALVEKYGGWIDRQVVDDFAYFSGYIINEFKDKVKLWTTSNEPVSYTQLRPGGAPLRPAPALRRLSDSGTFL